MKTKNLICIVLLIFTFAKCNNLLKVFPNPAKDYFIVEYILTAEINHAVIEIVDAMGRKLQSIALTNRKDQILIKTNALSSGLYNCIMLNNGKVISQTKITIE